MPYSEIEDRYNIPRDTTIVFRYLNEYKALDLLTTNELHFTQIKKFPRYDEYMFSLSDQKWIRDKYQNLPEAEANRKADREIKNYESIKADGYINCWNSNTYESRLLWNDYVGVGNGICIKSSVSKFKHAISSAKQNIYLSEVHYFDPVSERLGIFNGIRMLSRKISDFQHESEIRAIILLPHDVKMAPYIRVSINLNELIDSIYFSTHCDEKFKAQIKKLAIEQELPNPIESKLNYQ